MVGFTFFSIDLFKSFKKNSEAFSPILTLVKTFLNLTGASPVNARSTLFRQAIAEFMAVHLNLAEFGLVNGLILPIGLLL